MAGAAKGEGLGNKFLAHIRETQAIAHVVRCFENDDITHVSGAIDPIADIETIYTELALADLDTLEKALQKVQKDLKKGTKEAKLQHDVLSQAKAALENDQPLRQLELEPPAAHYLASLQLLTHKPMLYIANVDENGFNQNPLLEQVKQHAAHEGAQVVAVCAAIESDIAELEPEDQKDFLDSLGLEEPGLHRVIRAGYELLGLQTYFTAGPKEARAWTVPKGATAPQAAGVIHTDFQKGFIRAEVISFDDYIEHQGEAGAKDAGRWRLEGKDYVLANGDVILFRFNV